MNELTHVDLFSGLGCWAIAAQANGVETVALCECEEWLAQGLERIWRVPCYRDVKTFPAIQYRGTWLLTGSPPCQPVSCAGKRKGKSDDRWLWDQAISVCQIVHPAWFCFENPPGINGLGLDGIISDLERIGYEVQAIRIPACAIDSPQDRDRFWIMGWIMGHTKRNGQSRTWNALQHGAENGDRQANKYRSTTQSRLVAASIGPADSRIEFRGKLYRIPAGLHELANATAAGIPKKLRSRFISALGNAIVWPIAAQIISAMKETE